MISKELAGANHQSSINPPSTWCLLASDDHGLSLWAADHGSFPSAHGSIGPLGPIGSGRSAGIVSGVARLGRFLTVVEKRWTGDIFGCCRGDVQSTPKEVSIGGSSNTAICKTSGANKVLAQLRLSRSKLNGRAPTGRGVSQYEPAAGQEVFRHLMVNIRAI